MAGFGGYSTTTFKSYRKRPLYDAASAEPFIVSRSKIDLFFECPKCFYLDRKKGVSRPSLPAFSLNSAVDALLKKEFDLLRKDGQSHALMKEYGIDAIPFQHSDLPLWRDDVYRYEGAKVLDKDTNFMVTGIIDDIWKDNQGKLNIVDYKSTSTSKPISLDDKWKQGYKKQMEVYQWIFRKLGHDVSDVGYFVFANADRGRPNFDGKLEFKLSIVPYKGDDSWVGPTLLKMKQCLNSDEVPQSGAECEYCAFNRKTNDASQ